MTQRGNGRVGGAAPRGGGGHGVRAARCGVRAASERYVSPVQGEGLADLDAAAPRNRVASPARCGRQLAGFAGALDLVAAAAWSSRRAARPPVRRLVFYCRATSASTAPSRRMCCPTQCASYLDLCGASVSRASLLLLREKRDERREEEEASSAKNRSRLPREGVEASGLGFGI